MAGEDILGNIAVLRNDDRTKKEILAQAKKIIQRPSVKSVFLKGDVKGRLRTTKVKHVLGEKNKIAEYKENGCSFKFDIESCYFSPRLSGERKLIASKIKSKDEVLVMFAGVGVYPIVIYKNSRPRRVVGVEIGRDCCKWFKENLVLNRIPTGRVEVVQGDVKKKIDKNSDKFDVVIHYNKNRTKAEQLKKIILNNSQMAGIVKGSIFDESDIDEIKEQSQRINGEISVIVNCATIPIVTRNFSDHDWSNMQDHYDINIKSSFNILKAFYKDWERNKFGKYIGLTTLYTEQPKSELLAYITAKSALNGFIKALSFELAPKGIRLNLVSPGMVDTPLIANVPEKVRLLSAAQTPLRTIATPEDIANTIAFLASDKSNYLTGETIRVNGGQFML